MRRIYGGAATAIIGITALIVAQRHHPEANDVANIARSFGGKNVLGILTLTNHRSAWSQTAYDLVRIGGWTLAILGLATIAIGLVRYAHRGEHPE